MLTLLLVMGLMLRQMPDGLRFGVESVLAMDNDDDCDEEKDGNDGGNNETPIGARFFNLCLSF